MAALRGEFIKDIATPHDQEDGCSSEEEGEFDDSEEDPTFDVVEETQSALSKISLKKSNPRKTNKRDEEDGSDCPETEVPELDAKDMKCFEVVEKLIKDDQTEKLKVDQCKVYLRKYGLRLTGKKDTLIGRIREHVMIKDGGGERKYPISSFVVNCKGDACTGDVVMFEQNVYEMFSIASRSATGPPCGTRLVAGRIVKESYGAAKQQHTFTIEVLWSKGERPLPPLYPLLIKGRNLYRLKTMRQRWNDEEHRRKVLQEKHSRGSVAGFSRENRIQEKKIRKIDRSNRIKEKKSHKILQEVEILNQVKPFEAAVVQQHKLQHGKPPQHTLNSSDLTVLQPETIPKEFLESGLGQHPPMRFDKPTTAQYQSVALPKHVIQHQQAPQHNLNSVYSNDLQQASSLRENLEEGPRKYLQMRFDKPIIPDNLNNCPQGRKQSSGNFHSHEITCRTLEQQNIVLDTKQLHHHARQHQQYQPPRQRAHYSHYRQPLVGANSSHRSGPGWQNPMQHRESCSFYRQGRCHFGENCKNLHDNWM